MAEGFTSRFKLPFPKGLGKVRVGAVDIQELAERLDAILYPPGALRLTAQANVDEGWLACEGQAISRTTYAALFAEIGTAYGEGDKAATFNVPDFRERVPVGAGGALPRGARGGEATHVLTVPEMPSHGHSTHVVYSEPGGHIGGAVLMRDNFVDFGEADIPTSAAGGGGAHNNMQPYTVCNVWIKT
jgi:microcystin-dependent protein